MDDTVRDAAGRDAPVSDEPVGAPESEHPESEHPESDHAESDHPESRDPAAAAAAHPPPDLGAEPGAERASDFVLDHDGPWSEEDYRTLSAKSVARGDGRAELIDGVLLIGPGPTPESVRAIAHTRSALDDALPDGLCVLDVAPVRMGPDCVLVPDLVVTRATAEEPATPLVDADDVLMVVEVVGPEHGALDRAFKPQIYARSRVPYLLLVDHDTPYAAASMVIGGRYHEYARAAGAEDLELEEPFRLLLPPAPAPPDPVGPG